MMKTSADMEEKILKSAMLMRSCIFEAYQDYGVVYPKFEDVLPDFREFRSEAGDLDQLDLMEQFLDRVERSVREKVDHLNRTQFRFVPVEGSA